MVSKEIKSEREQHKKLGYMMVLLVVVLTIAVVLAISAKVQQRSKGV